MPEPPAMPEFDMAMPEFEGDMPQQAMMPQAPQMAAGNCFGPAVRPVAFEAPAAPQMQHAAQMRTAMEAKNADRQAEIQARMDEMKQAMEARRAQIQGNCRQM
jgi:hypothetical protein